MAPHQAMKCKVAGGDNLLPVSSSCIKSPVEESISRRPLGRASGVRALFGAVSPPKSATKAVIGAIEANKAVQQASVLGPVVADRHGSMKNWREHQSVGAKSFRRGVQSMAKWLSGQKPISLGSPLPWRRSRKPRPSTGRAAFAASRSRGQ